MVCCIFIRKGYSFPLEDAEPGRGVGLSVRARRQIVTGRFLQMKMKSNLNDTTALFCEWRVQSMMAESAILTIPDTVYFYVSIFFLII